MLTLAVYYQSKRDFSPITDWDSFPVRTMAYSLLGVVKTRSLAYGPAVYTALLLFCSLWSAISGL